MRGDGDDGDEDDNDNNWLRADYGNGVCSCVLPYCNWGTGFPSESERSVYGKAAKECVKVK